MRHSRADLREGMTVYSLDGEKLGKIIRLEENRFWIEKGFFFPKDYLVRYDTIDQIQDNDIILSIRREDLTRADQYTTEEVTTTERAAPTAGSVSSVQEESLTGGRAARREGALFEGGEEVRIPVAEEEATVEKHAHRTGAARIHKTVETEEKHFTVPVRHERVEVERVPVEKRELKPGEARIAEEDITVPVYEEEVEIRKRPVVREEVRVRKTAEIEEREVDTTLHKERVQVEQPEETTELYEEEPRPHS